MQETKNKYGIEGQLAPELKVKQWVDGAGMPLANVQLKDYAGKFKVLYFFQSWCPGCHSRGLPALKEMVKALKGNDQIVFMAIQTVFEGAHANTYEKMVETQKNYNLAIPFGHDAEGDNPTKISNTMLKYRTGGTPWFVLVDQNNKVVFNDYDLNTEKTIEYLQSIARSN